VARLLERDEELGTLVQAARDAAGGRGSVTLVSGEAGIGKTALLRALRDRLPGGCTILIGACEPLSVPLPLGPIREIVEAAGGGELTNLAGEDRLALARWMTRALQDRAPVVAVIEDAHWADPLTLDVVRLAARRVADMSAALVITLRDDEAGANPALALLLGDLAGAPAVRRLALGALSAAAVRELAGAGGLDAAELVRATGGNPFLVTEAIAAGRRLPASVRDAALARAGRLSPEARRVVDAAAVIGQEFDHRLLTAVVPDAEDAVEAALARGVLVADGSRLGFRHDLIREAIETSISPPRRAQLHARVYACLAAQPGAASSARLAHHAELAGLTTEACRHAQSASLEAERLGALSETRLQSERALRLGDELTDAERFDLLLRYSRAANFSSTRYEDAIAGARQALAIAERLGEPVAQARALELLAWALWSLDRMEDAKAQADRAVAVLATTDETAALARARSTSIRMEATAFDPAAAIAAGSDALRLADAAELHETRLDISISVGLARGHGGDADALAELEQVLRAARDGGLTVQAVRSYVNLTYLAAVLRRHPLLERIAAEALDYCDQHDARIPSRVIEGYRARGLMDRGQWDAARAAAARCAASWHSEVAVARALDGLIAVRRGEARAGELLATAWDDLPPSPEGSRHGIVRSALVEAAWLRGDRAAALAELREAGASPATARFARSGGELALWAARYGTDAQIPAGIPEPLALELEGDWRTAIEAWHQLDAPYEAAVAALPGDDRAAREALAILRRLGAAAAADAFRRDREARGGRPVRGPRATTLAHPAGLTQRQQDVLDELATGASNPAIAAALHLSERTVSHHVSAILAKLGVSTRQAAIDAARRQGLVAQHGPVSSAR
jgi:DNA-binding CsgD family transcriptional regulator/tetratricopeptide (TPR) repeat protein